MEQSGGKKGAKPAQTREERLKAALKANMAKRKAQTRARTAQDNKPTSSSENG